MFPKCLIMRSSSNIMNMYEWLYDGCIDIWFSEEFFFFVYSVQVVVQDPAENLYENNFDNKQKTFRRVLF